MLRMGVSIGCGNRFDAGIVSSTLLSLFETVVSMESSFAFSSGELLLVIVLSIDPMQWS
jgi:hypothetical protein